MLIKKQLGSRSDFWPDPDSINLDPKTLPCGLIPSNSYRRDLLGEHLVDDVLGLLHHLVQLLLLGVQPLRLRLSAHQRHLNS